MLQIDHVYEFLYQELFKDFDFWYLFNGVPKIENASLSDILIFTHKDNPNKKIFFYDQEPFLPKLVQPYLNYFTEDQRPGLLVTSERSLCVQEICNQNNLQNLYYFFHGYAALDWYRGYYALNYNKTLRKTFDFISFNRLITNDRSYRIYFISKLAEFDLLKNNLVSFGVSDDNPDWRDEVADTSSKLSYHAKNHIEQHLSNIHKLVIDSPNVHSSASADILRTLGYYDYYNNNKPDYDALWHVVTETVFYYDKLHLTEKIFKPIVSKQPFMLLAAPGNLAYLRSYGFKTFDGIIDESYDAIQDNDQRINAVVEQLRWYCNLSDQEKSRVLERLAPIVEHNFHHFYGAFRHIITKELLNNCRTLFKKIGYDDKTIAYENIYQVLTN